jgi:tetratricopeptide (TPR) repeat protein
MKRFFILLGLLISVNCLFAGGRQQSQPDTRSRVIITHDKGEKPAKVYINGSSSAYTLVPGETKEIGVKEGAAKVEVVSETGDRSSLEFNAQENITRISFNTITQPTESNVIVRYMAGKRSANVQVYLNGEQVSILNYRGDSVTIPAPEGTNTILVARGRRRMSVSFSASSNDTRIEFGISKILRKVEGLKVAGQTPKYAYKIASLAVTGAESLAVAQRVEAPSPARPAASTTTNPNDAVARYNRGNEYYLAYDLDRALQEYDAAIRLNPNYADAYVGRGNVYNSKDDGEQARADYDRAAQLDSKYAGFVRAYGAYMDKNYDKAIEEYTLAIRNRINLFVTYNERGASYYYLDNLDDAIADFTEAIRLAPKSVHAYMNRYQSYFRNGDIDNALTDSSTVIELKPDYPDAYFWRGLFYRMIENYSKALLDFNRAIELKLDSPGIYFWRGDTFYFLGKYDEAISDLSIVINGIPGDFEADAYFARAYCYEKTGEYRKALADADMVLKLDPANEQIPLLRRRVRAQLASE